MAMTTTSLDVYLTADQQERMAEYIDFITAIGHGEVYVRVVNGHERFIGARLEEDFPRSSTISKLRQTLQNLFRR